MEAVCAFRAQPFESIFDIRNDFREFRFGSEAVIERDQDIAVRESELSYRFGDAFAIAHNQRAAMERDNRGAHPGVRVTVDIRFDFQITRALVNDSLFLGWLSGP